MFADAPTAPVGEDGCTFLSSVGLRIPYFWCSEEQREGNRSVVLDLLKAKDYSSVLNMAQTGQLAPREPLPIVGCSLLRLAMRSSFDSSPVAKDISILLDTVAARGESLDEEDFLSACECGLPAVIREFLARGVPLPGDALHALVDRGFNGFTRESGDMLLEAKAEVDGMGSAKVTPIFTAAKQLRVSDAIQAMTWLLDHGADPNGGTGRQTPLHAYVSSFSAQASGIDLLVKRRADINRRDEAGCTPLHCALSGHMRLETAKRLKAMGADVSIEDNKGVRPSQMILRKDMPKEAAEFEDRPMNAEEQRVLEAMDHPVAKMFENSPLREIGWVLRTNPEAIKLRAAGGSSGSDDDFAERRQDESNTKLSDLLNGHKPSALVLGLPLTRYSEIVEDVRFESPPEGFTVKGILMKIYEYYQAPFDEEQLESIRQNYARGGLGDTFGYIRKNVRQADEEGSQDGEGDEEKGAGEGRGDGEERPAKKQRVQRIELRGDSIFYEGFHNCKFFADDRTLWGQMSLGS